ncbi:MAG: MBL-fold metallo-hydrolase superfamily [uncultured Truepera sp.]|uniref:MBL-fold metallo-hydrolase superfamily n=1 Tax=uncultured Truepera sp. TaxID=543023 RepID=A0A6J4UYS9_9DEIN|nr:MAG: MBL-fold metallo-hydrolase superfamily [uncultured Truepera sp.]
MLSIQALTVGPLQENCYLLTDTQTQKAVLVDPGDEAERIIAAVNGFSLTAVWLTHAHFDHVGALSAVHRHFPVPVYLHPDDRELFAHAAQSAAFFGLVLEQPDLEPTPLTHGQTLTLGEHEATCLFTPGHAPGHMAFYLPEHGFVLAGDALFQGSVGRTDLPGGDHAQLLASIRRELLTLPDETRVLPGHGPETTVGTERRANPFLR